MTDQEINEAIAVKRGWKREFSLMGDCYEWNQYDKDSKYICGGEYSTPDFANDWRLAGELLEEIIEIDGSIEIVHVTFLVKGYRISCHVNDDGDVYGSPTRAIAEAWLEMHQ
jgi:MoaA/NifB/PqqE/SkfB family radical SAM enzyme